MKDKPSELDVAQFDPILLEAIEHSLKLDKRLFSPALIKLLRTEALILLATDPHTQDLVAQLRARQPSQESGKSPIDDLGAEPGVAEQDSPPASNGTTGPVRSWQNGHGGPR